MDAPSAGISLDGVIFALFLLAITGLSAMVMVFGTNIRKDIAKLFETMEKHSDDDRERFDNISTRVGRLAQRVTNVDHRTEDA